MTTVLLLTATALLVALSAVLLERWLHADGYGSAPPPDVREWSGAGLPSRPYAELALRSAALRSAALRSGRLV